jgi:phosphoserine aminotransferase
MLPGDVMERAQTELVDWNGTGISVMEMSHRRQSRVYSNC